MTNNPTCPHCGTAIEEHEAELCLNKWVGETITRVTPRRLWIATSDGGKSATRTSDYQHEVEQWVKEYPVVFGKPMSVSHWDIYPCYSADIAAAWEVVEKMCKQFEYFPIRLHRLSGDGRWYAKVCDYEYRTDAPTAPLAICRAAIMAAMREDNT